MMRLASPVLAVLACLILAVTAQGMAFARGQSPAQGQMTLCTGQGAMMVFIDADGRPTSPPQLCMDGALALFGVAASAPMPMSRHVEVSATHWHVMPHRLSHADRPRLSARDPPRV